MHAEMEQPSDAPGYYLRREDTVFELSGINSGTGHLTQAAAASRTSYHVKPFSPHWPSGYRKYSRNT